MNLNVIKCYFAAFLFAYGSVYATERSEVSIVLYNKQQTVIKLVRGDITNQQFDNPAHAALVNAANQFLLGGAGVCGAIYKAAGWVKENPCEKYPADKDGVRCPPGEARITDGGLLAPRKIIHAVGPDCRIAAQEQNKKILLTNAYQNSLRLALENDITTVAFPCISSAIFGYDPQEAAVVALAAVTRFLKDNTGIKEVRLVVFDQASYDLYKQQITLLSDLFSVCRLTNT